MEAKPKVLIVYTGGTIGMINDPETNQLISFDFEHIDKHVPELNRLNIDLEAVSFGKPIDSSEMNLGQWAKIAETVFENYERYNGFVVLHGSDTMAFTASALSFMLQGLKKPVILTGSQLPIGTIRTDGKENLITAIEIAAAIGEDKAPIVQEVAVYFEYSLYRGNRSSKISANQFEAFDSPNYPKLAVAGVDIDYRYDKLFRTDLSVLKLEKNFSSDVALLKLYPGMNFELYRGLFDSQKVKAIVIETFGAGNAPSDKVFQDSLSKFCENGGIAMNITQCSSGAVQQGKYETSNFFSKIGVMSGADMTSEAAITKLMYLLNKGLTGTEIKKAIATDIVGEVSLF